MTTTLDLLDGEVETLRGSVAGAGAVVGDDLAPPRRQGLSQRVDLLDVVSRAAGDGLVDKHSGLAGIIGQIQVSNRLLGQPGTEYLVVGIADAKPEQHPVVAPLVE